MMGKAPGLVVQNGSTYVFRRRWSKPVADATGKPFFYCYMGAANKLSLRRAESFARHLWEWCEEYERAYRSADEPMRKLMLEHGGAEHALLALLDKRWDQQEALATLPQVDTAASEAEQVQQMLARIRAQKALDQTQEELKPLIEWNEREYGAKSKPDVDDGNNTLSRLVEIWQQRARPKSPGSVAKAKLWTARLADHLDDKALEDIEAADIRAFRDHIEASEDFTRVTARHGLATLNTLFRHAVDAGLIDTNPFAGVTVHLPKPDSYTDAVKDKGFTSEQIKKLFAALDTLPHDDHRWTLRLMTYHGLRASECAILRTDDIEKIDGVVCLHVRDTHGRRIKTQSSARTIPLHSKCKAFAAYATNRDGYVFGGNDNQISRAKRLQDVLNPWIKEQIGAGSLHGLRHSFRTLCRDLEMPLEVSAAIMGHALPGEHFAYGRRPNVKVLRDWLEKVDPLG